MLKRLKNLIWGFIFGTHWTGNCYAIFGLAPDGKIRAGKWSDYEREMRG